MAVFYISVGSNIDKENNVPSALKQLKSHFSDIEVSSLYECEAVGFTGPEFYNLVIRASTNQSVIKLVALCKQLELSHGRAEHAAKNTPRTLDLDLLLYDDLIMQTPAMLPRPEILTRAFVLSPLAELAPHLIHPVVKKSYQQLWAAFDKNTQPIRKLPLPWQL